MPTVGPARQSRNELSSLRRAEARAEAAEKELFEVNDQLDHYDQQLEHLTRLCKSKDEEIERLKAMIAEGSHPAPWSEQQEMTSHISKLEEELKQKTSHFVAMLEGNADFYKTWGDALLKRDNQELETQNVEYRSEIQELTSKISNLQVPEPIQEALIELKSRTINDLSNPKYANIKRPRW